MSPLDDELRTALSSRTAPVGTGPDFFAGVERRAKRMRRQRVAATVAGSALAVTALGLGGPLLVSSLTSTAGPLDQATTAPADESAVDYALDPADPWPYRGVPLAELGPELLEAVRVQIAAVAGVDVADVRVSPLYGQRDEPSGQVELVVLGVVDGLPSWGVVRTTESGPELLLDEDLAPGSTALAAALPGEAVSRLLVLAAPGTQVLYCRSTGSSCVLGGTDGLLRTPLDGDTTSDSYQVFGANGTIVFEAPAPDGERIAESEGPATDAPPNDEVPAPANAGDWPTRGGASPELVKEALDAFALDVGATREEVGGRLLYGADRDGRNVLVLSVRQAGDGARVYAYVEAAGNGSGFLLDPAPGASVLAVLIPAGTVFADRDWLLVVPEPRAGQVLYSADETSEPRPVASQGTGAAVVIDRSPGASGDRVLVLDGNGDPDRPLYRGTVAEIRGSQ